jgi:hypothetical protein
MSNIAHVFGGTRWTPYFWAGQQIRYQRREVLKWFVEHTGPYARCGNECGPAFPLRDFKKVTDQQRDR